MRHAIIENGIVTNVVIADEVMGRANGWVPTEEAGPGWIYDGNIFNPVPPDPIAEAITVRAERDKRLIASDVYVLPDRWAIMTAEQQQAWSIYRQALRDIPLQPGFPWQIQWPIKPE
jgi:hypothetical protein